MFQTEQKQATASHLVVQFCDDTTLDKVYKASQFGMIEARQAYTEFVTSGLDTGVLNYPPHVLSAQLTENGETAREDFICRCRKEQRVSA